MPLTAAATQDFLPPLNEAASRPIRARIYLRRSDTVLLGFAVLLTGCLSVLRLYEWTKTTDARHSINKAHAAFRAADRVIKDLLDLEAGQRGYLLTHDQRYLTPYKAAVHDFNNAIAEFKTEVVLAGTPSNAISDLTDVATRKLRQVEATLEADRTRGPQAALEIVRNGVGQRLMEDARLQGEALANSFFIMAAGESKFLEDFTRDNVAFFLCATGCNLLIIMSVSLRLNNAFGRHRILLQKVSDDEQEFRLLVAKLQRVREDERERLAREIHDELGQALTGIKIDLSTMSRYIADGKSDAALSKVSSSVVLVDTTISNLRRIATELRPAILDRLGLVPAIKWQASQFQARTGIPVATTLPDVDVLLDNDRRIALFRVLQESLTNVARHAQATFVSIALTETPHELVLSIADDGVGLPKTTKPSNSLGLVGMRERARLVGGTFSIQDGQNGGVVVLVSLPRSQYGQPAEQSGAAC